MAKKVSNGNGHAKKCAKDTEEKDKDNRFCPGLLKIMVSLKDTKEVPKTYFGHVADGAD